MAGFDMLSAVRQLAASSAILCLGMALVYGQRRGGPPAIQPKPEELAQISEKSGRIEAGVRGLKARRANPDLLADVEVYAKAGRFLLEFPELIVTQPAIDHAILVLDEGIARARQLADGASPWNQGKKQIHAYYSAIDGSVQPYAITLPGKLRPCPSCAPLRVDARPAEQHHRD